MTCTHGDTYGHPDHGCTLCSLQEKRTGTGTYAEWDPFDASQVRQRCESDPIPFD